MSALSPYRVIELSSTATQHCGQIFADLGADVILVEQPGGSPARLRGPFAGDDPLPENSLSFWAYNRNKRGVTLDIETAEGRALLAELLATADVLIEGFPPGHLSRLGLGYDDLAEGHPRLVVVSVTPFGQHGPKANWAAADLTVMAASSIVSTYGDEDRPPVRIAVPQAEVHGAGEAAAGCLLALAGRQTTGRGQHVDVSCQAACTQCAQSNTLSGAWGEKDLSRGGSSLKFGPVRLRGHYPCKDGWVSILFVFGSAIGPMVARMMAVICDQGFCDAATRDKDWVGMTEIILSGRESPEEIDRVQDCIAAFCLAHTKEELYEIAVSHGLLIAPIRNVADLVASPQLAAREYWERLHHPTLGRDVVYPGAWVKLSETPLTLRRRAPTIGEHNAEVFAELRGAADGSVQRSTAPPASASPRSTTKPADGFLGDGAVLPLVGLKVLDLTWGMVGPWAIRHLADYGATVVRIESLQHPDAARTWRPFKDGVAGGERAGLYINCNVGKLGITLNFDHPAGRELLLRLVRWADVLGETFAPDVLRSRKLDYAHLREVNPALVMFSSCLNGQYGPHMGLVGFGNVGAAVAGFPELCGWPDRPPAWVGAYTDYPCPRYIASAVLAALDHRRRTGQGQYIDVAQVEAALHVAAPAILDYSVNGRLPVRAGGRSPDAAPHGCFPCRGQERWVAIAVETEDQWRSFCQAASRPEWTADPRFTSFAARKANEDALEALVASWTRTMDREEAEALLQRHGVPTSAVFTVAEASFEPQLNAWGNFVDVDHVELGRVPVEGLGFRLSGTPARVVRGGPGLGEHNDYVLREILHMGDDEIADLAASGALE